MPMLFFVGCEHVDHSGETPEEKRLSFDSVAKMFSALPIDVEQMKEVHDAVSVSSDNGYDEEYMLRDLLVSPGAGVGMSEEIRAFRTKSYSRPLKDLIAEYLALNTKADGNAVGSGLSPEEYLRILEKSDIQIYWPNSDSWDGAKWPTITFDPGNDAEVNVGYRLALDGNGERIIEEVAVDETMAAECPVWVINGNDDSGYQSFELLKRNSSGGGAITVRPSGVDGGEVLPLETSSGTVRTLVLKDFMMRRNYDCWFAGASEFFFKMGSVEDFTASTEAELKLYSPQVTDFMLVVKRNQVGQTIPLNVVLVSQWTDQLDDIAFMLTEDDGGTKTEWKCSAVVKIKSKSYGFDVSLPFNSKDDIVWRGQLAARYIEKYDGIASRFGDVDVTFSFLEQ